MRFRQFLFVLLCIFVFIYSCGFFCLTQPVPHAAVLPIVKVPDSDLFNNVDKEKAFVVKYGQQNYLGFFQRLGKVYYPHVGDMCQIITVLRTHPRDQKRMWFLGDYRTDKAHRGHSLGFWFMSILLLPMTTLFSSRMYGLIMNPKGKDVAYLKRWNGLLTNFPIDIYLIDVADIGNLPEKYKDTKQTCVRALDTMHLKRLSNADGAPLPILHVLPKDYVGAKNDDALQTSFNYKSPMLNYNNNNVKLMFWLPPKTPCAFNVWAEAVIIHRGFAENEDFRWLSTADM